MEKIASFKVDHTKLQRGVFTSRIDGDCFTYDVRVCQPYVDELMDVRAMHTIEHLMATYLRNNKVFGDKIIYVGGMMCRTGFYVVARNVKLFDIIELLKSCFLWISVYKDEIPGATKIECGSYLEHNLQEANKIAERFYNEILTNMQYRNYTYPGVNRV